MSLRGRFGDVDRQFFVNLDVAAGVVVDGDERVGEEVDVGQQAQVVDAGCRGAENGRLKRIFRFLSLGQRDSDAGDDDVLLGCFVRIECDEQAA